MRASQQKFLTKETGEMYATSNGCAKGLGGAILHAIKNGEESNLYFIGVGALNTAVKAVAIASNISLVPHVFAVRYEDIETADGDRTRGVLAVEKLPDHLHPASVKDLAVDRITTEHYPWLLISDWQDRFNNGADAVLASCVGAQSIGNVVKAVAGMSTRNKLVVLPRFYETDIRGKPRTAIRMRIILDHAPS